MVPIPDAPPLLGPRWFCINAFPFAEMDVLAGLLDQGFEAHLPLERIERRKRQRGLPDKITVEDVPFFPRYLFARFDRERDPWRPIASTRGVRRIFGTTPERPTPVPVGVVEALMMRAGIDGVIDARPNALRLAAITVGERVRILEGPFADLTAVCAWSSEKRVRLLMEVMGGPQPVEVAREIVEPVA